MQRTRYWFVHPTVICFNPHPSRRTGATQSYHPDHVTRMVSILTRPGGRVQPDAVATIEARAGFQSSPVPEDGCNFCTARSALSGICFNPHPSRRTGATPSCRLLLSQFDRFNPHPSRRTGATTYGFVVIRFSATGFNPHPSRRTGATTSARVCSVVLTVSILTRPGGRVQPSNLRILVPSLLVSILTRPGGRVQPGTPSAAGLTMNRFNPHPSRRTGATTGTQQHLNRGMVSILTRPGGRVQPVTNLLRRWHHGFNPHPSRRTGATKVVHCER